MTVRAVGTGGGSRDTPDRPNITRVVIGACGAERDLREGDVTVVESTVDDLDPRLWPSVVRAVRAAVVTEQHLFHSRELAQPQYRYP